jgi:hypothetical protein
LGKKRKSRLCGGMSVLSASGHRQPDRPYPKSARRRHQLGTKEAAN